MTAEWSYDVIRGTAEATGQRKHTRETSDHTTTSQPVDVAYHKVCRQQQLEFSEADQQAEWGYWYYATEDMEGLTYQSGSDNDVRGRFIEQGRLSNIEDSNFRGIEDNFPVFGFSVDLGEVDASAGSTLFQISLHQENCVQFEGAKGNQTVPCLWRSYFSDDTAAVSYRTGIQHHNSEQNLGHSLLRRLPNYQ